MSVSVSRMQDLILDSEDFDLLENRTCFIVSLGGQCVDIDLNCSYLYLVFTVTCMCY